jgi:hypothetical protein
MDNKELVQYFINETNKKFERLEEKVDLLISFKWQLVGGSVVLSLFASVAVHVFFNR